MEEKSLLEYLMKSEIFVDVDVRVVGSIGVAIGALYLISDLVWFLSTGEPLVEGDFDKAIAMVAVGIGLAFSFAEGPETE